MTSKDGLGAIVTKLLNRSEDYYRRWLANLGPDEAVPLSSCCEAGISTEAAAKFIARLDDLMEKNSTIYASALAEFREGIK